MQCKDIPDAPIIEFVWARNNENYWANNAFEDEGDVRQIMPGGYDIPWKLAWAKMNQLIKKGLVDGCPCGCRGDYVVTDKGCEAIGKPRHVRFVGGNPI